MAAGILSISFKSNIVLQQSQNTAELGFFSALKKLEID